MDKNCFYENFYINTVMHFMMMVVNVIVYVRHKYYVFCVFLKGFMLLVISIFTATCIHIYHCQVNILIGTMYKSRNMGKKIFNIITVCSWRTSRQYIFFFLDKFYLSIQDDPYPILVQILLRDDYTNLIRKCVWDTMGLKI